MSRRRVGANPSVGHWRAMTARSTADEPIDFVNKFNLSKLRLKLLNQKPYKRFCALIARCEALWSIGHDLDHVTASVDLMKAAAVAAGERLTAHDYKTGIQHEAYATHAVILYSRATDASSKGRSTFSVRDCYDARQLKLHREVIDLRNQSIAHYGTTTHPGGAWYEPGILFEVEESQTIGKMRVWDHGRRSNFRGYTVEALAELVPVALAHVTEQVGQRSEELAKYTDQLANEDQVFERLLLEHRVFAEQIKSPSPTGGWYEPTRSGPKF